MASPLVDLARIAAHGGSQQAAFEEFCCQLARRSQVPAGSRFQRNGVGADLGLECLWKLPGGRTWGWQAKFVFRPTALKAQVEKSLRAALSHHPSLSRFVLCVPFVPSAAQGAGGRGSSQATTLERYVKEWDALAGRSLVEVWDASELTSRLLELDASGGRGRYWFDQHSLTPAWFSAQLRKAVAIAGPRYTPDVHVNLGARDVFSALGATEDWRAKKAAQLEILAGGDERRRIGTPRNSTSLPGPEEASPAFAEASKALPALHQELASRLDASWADDRAVVDRCRGLFELAAVELAADLDAKHPGPTKASESRHFRDFQAAYMADFPAAALDSAREQGARLGHFAAWLSEPAHAAADIRLLALTGPAGIGKTHALCDIARHREEEGLLTLVLFGTQFRSRSSLEELRANLGLDGTWSARQLLDALEAAAEQSRHRVLILIDAINETASRAYWNTELPALIDEVAQRPWLALCVSCRDIFANAILPAPARMPRHELTGFAGHEFDACGVFFAHYGLNPPLDPLLTPECSNPLLLKLTCETLRDKGLTSLPEGWLAFHHVITARLSAVDRALRASFGPLARTAASSTMEVIVGAMLGHDRRALALSTCMSELATHPTIGAPHQEVLNTLIEEGLLVQIPGSGAAGLLSAPDDELIFGYERVGDHLIARCLLSRCEDIDEVRATVAQVRHESGLLEALAVQLSDRFGAELLDVLEEPTRAECDIWIRSLQWRPAASLTGSVGRRLLDLAARNHRVAVLDTLMFCAMRSGPLDAHWFHREMTSRSLGDRDALWCPYLFGALQRTPEQSPVRRLLDAWRNQELVGRLDDDRATRWLLLLCWMCAANDRSVRDEATRAATAVTLERRHIWSAVISMISDVDDDYILERTLLAAYGCFLVVKGGKVPQELGSILVRILESRAHAGVRDAARCLVDLCPSGRRKRLTPARRLPQHHKWPLTFPSEEEIETIVSSAQRSEYPQLRSSVINELGDFAHYTMERALRGYLHAVNLPAARRWVLREVIRLGYSPERFARFDIDIVRAHGSERNRDGWAERLGKKYQWIALARLVGIVGEAVAPAPEFASDTVPPPGSLVGQTLRDIDPSLLGPRGASSRGGSCWSGIDPQLDATGPADDARWVADSAHMVELAKRLWQLSVCSEDGWVPLEACPRWTSKHTVSGDRGFRRQIWLQVRAYLVPKRRFRRLWLWLRARQCRDLPRGIHLSDSVFIGEYPWGASMRRATSLQLDPEYVEDSPAAFTPASVWVDGEFTEDCSRDGRKGAFVPVGDLLKNLRWDGRGGFISASGRRQAVDPSFAAEGFGACLVRRDWLEKSLNEQDASLIWAIFGERLPGDYHALPRMDFSYCAALHGGRLQWAADPVVGP